MKKIILGTIILSAVLFAVNTNEEISLPELPTTVADASKAFVEKNYFTGKYQIKCDELKPLEMYQKSICMAQAGQIDISIAGFEVIEDIDFRGFCMKQMVKLQKDNADYKKIQSDIDTRFKTEGTEMGLCLKALEISGVEFKKVNDSHMEVIK